MSFQVNWSQSSIRTGKRLVTRQCLRLHAFDHAEPFCLCRSRHRGIWLDSLESKSIPGQNLNADFLAVAVNDLSLVVLDPSGIDLVGVDIVVVAAGQSGR